VEPKIYFPEDHDFNEQLIDPNALFVMKKLRDAGHTAYLVGGGVRDILAGLKPKDFDISTSALPEEIKRIFRRNCILIGRRFRLAHIRFGHKVFEVSTFRAGDPKDSELIVRDNEWGTPEEDALRRDFSINGLFYDPHHKTVIDYVDGWHDLKEGVLRSIGNPEIRFKQDPVRMIRLLKFHARFGWIIEKKNIEALEYCRHEITKSAPARILEELLRMLESGHGSDFFRLLLQYGFLKHLIPKLEYYLKTERGHQVFDYLETADLVHQKNDAITLERSILLSCLLFPIVETRIDMHQQRHQKPPNLGEISLIVLSVIRETMTDAFTHFPRKLSSFCASILSTQYRLTPLTKKRHLSTKFIQDKNFPQALRFFRIRALVDETLADQFYEWEKVYHQMKHRPGFESKKRRPRKRRSRRA